MGVMMSIAETTATDLAGRQGGYLTRRQALACGMTEDEIRSRVRNRRWGRVKPGLYMLAGFQPTLRGRLLAATAVLGAVVSHQSAAELHDLPGVARGLAVVTVRIRTTNRFPEVIVHQSTDLTDRRVVEIEGLPTTDVIRTLIDLFPILKKPSAIGKIIDRLVIDGRATLEEIAREVELLARHGKPGIKVGRAAIEPRLGETYIGESEVEALALRLIREWGFPEPCLQYPLPWRSPRKGRVDFAYPHVRLIIEIDGRAWHATLDAFESDRMRDNHAQLAGWRVLRITYRMMVDRPEEVREMIRQALAGVAA
jgi:hypothetical protein